MSTWGNLKWTKNIFSAETEKLIETFLLIPRKSFALSRQAVRKRSFHLTTTNDFKHTVSLRKGATMISSAGRKVLCRSYLVSDRNIICKSKAIYQNKGPQLLWSVWIWSLRNNILMYIKFTRCKRVVSFTPRLLYQRGNNSRHGLISL
jgi:hypothetical protein